MLPLQDSVLWWRKYTSKKEKMERKKKTCEIEVRNLFPYVRHYITLSSSVLMRPSTRCPFQITDLNRSWNFGMWNVFATLQISTLLKKKRNETLKKFREIAMLEVCLHFDQTSDSVPRFVTQFRCFECFSILAQCNVQVFLTNILFLLLLQNSIFSPPFSHHYHYYLQLWDWNENKKYPR